MKFVRWLARVYVWNFYGVLVLLLIILVFGVRAMETRDWVHAGLSLFIPVAAPIGYFFLGVVPKASVDIITRFSGDVKQIGVAAVELKRVRRLRPKISAGSPTEESIPSWLKKKISNISWAAFAAIGISLLSLKRSAKLGAAPSVYFEGDPNGAIATVVSVRPKGSGWIVLVRCSQSKSGPSSMQKVTVSKLTREFNLGSMKFRVIW
jgi:hypothetical protein